MLKTSIRRYLLFAICFLFTSQISAQSVELSEDTKSTLAQFLNGVEMSGNWFIAYRDGYEEIQTLSVSVDREHTSAFVLKRSYFTLRKDLNEVFSVRYTQDLTIDREGEDEGNVETRLKYLYGKADLTFDSGILSEFGIEVGMVHTPWLDYEQDINSYRVQDNMAIERAQIISSADFGIAVAGNIGPEMDKEFLDNVNDAMTGKYLSFMLGVYNGGGYSAVEKNLNKVFSGRLSVRPLPELLPQIQLSGFAKLGKGNTVSEPDYRQYLAFVAYTGKHVTITSQYHTGIGDFGGMYVDPTNDAEALENSGYSFFSELKIPKTNFAIWGRYDAFSVEEIDDETIRYITGITYKMSNNLRLVLNTEQGDVNGLKEQVYELNLEIVF